MKAKSYSEQQSNYRRLVKQIVELIVLSEANEEVPRGLSYHFNPDKILLTQEGHYDEETADGRPHHWVRDDIDRVQYRED